MNQSVAIAWDRCGKTPFDDYALISALNHLALVALTHTPNQMKFCKKTVAQA